MVIIRVYNVLFMRNILSLDAHRWTPYRSYCDDYRDALNVCSAK